MSEAAMGNLDIAFFSGNASAKINMIEIMQWTVLTD